MITFEITGSFEALGILEEKAPRKEMERIDFGTLNITVEDEEVDELTTMLDATKDISYRMV